MFACMRFIGTIDAGPVFGGRTCSFADLLLSADFPDSYVLDAEGPTIWHYHVVLNGSLSAKDRSRSCILHMYAGACFNALSFTQHLIAKDANDSEVFTASSGGAQSVPYSLRGILHEMQVSMHARTPMFSDSRSTRLIPISAAAMKQAIYLARRVLYMREGIDDGEHAFYQVYGKMNLADGGTKYIGIFEFVRAGSDCHLEDGSRGEGPPRIGFLLSRLCLRQNIGGGGAKPSIPILHVGLGLRAISEIVDQPY